MRMRIPPCLAACLSTTLLCLSGPSFAALAPIQLEGDFGDWAALNPLATDPAGDGAPVDFGRLWIANDQTRLFLRFETGGEVQPDEEQNIVLYLDTDLDAATGRDFGGIGADLVWELGRRRGTFYAPWSNPIEHADLGFLIGPTVSSTEFEIAFTRGATPAQGEPLFPGQQLRLIVADGSGGDRLPDEGSVSYGFAAGELPVPALGLERARPEHVRIATYNIQNDGLFQGGTRALALARIFAAIDPDVWVINEAWDHGAGSVAAEVESFLPSGPNEQWHAVKRDAGNVVVSRFPIKESWPIYANHRLTGALLDLRPRYDSDLLLIANHWRCCDADDERQKEADALIAWLRDARTPGGALTVAEGTPIVAAGDLNLVGARRPLETLLRGDIDDNGRWGPDSPPDWDGSDFDIPLTRHTDERVGYTWRDDWSEYYPGLLDFVALSGSVLELGKHYILDTRTMSAETLAAHGLLANDTERGSDHAPRVVDLIPTAGSVVPPPSAPPASVRLLPAAPNPFNPRTLLRFELAEAASLLVHVYDSRGYLVRSWPRRHCEAGVGSVAWDGRDDQGRALSSGLYYWRVQTERGWNPAPAPLVLAR